MYERLLWRLSVLAALLVLFSAMIDIRISLVLVITFVAIPAGYLLFQRTRRLS